MPESFHGPGEVVVSIVIPCYNDGRFLGDAVRSTEENRQGRHEVIVVNDGSNDSATLEALAEVAERGHRVLHQENRGLAAARNRGIAAAQGRYILPLDADNLIRPAYLSRGQEILDADPDIDVVYGDREFFGERTGRDRVAEFHLGRLLTWNYIDACAVFRKQAWERCGGYDETMPTAGFEDWDLWCRIACGGGGFVHLPEVLYDYRVRPDSMSSGMATPERVRAIMRHLHAKTIGLSIGDYVRAFQSPELHVEKFRRRPLRTLAGWFLQAYFPGAYARFHPRTGVRNHVRSSSAPE